MKIRAKFFCKEIIRTGWSDNGTPKLGSAVVYKFAAVYSNDPNHENKAFWDATPSAELSMTITNADAQVFELGQEYYLDFSTSD